MIKRVERKDDGGQLVGVIAAMDAGVLQVRAIPGAVHIVMPGPAGRSHDGRRIELGANLARELARMLTQGASIAEARALPKPRAAR